MKIIHNVQTRGNIFHCHETIHDNIADANWTLSARILKLTLHLRVFESMAAGTRRETPPSGIDKQTDWRRERVVRTILRSVEAVTQLNILRYFHKLNSEIVMQLQYILEVSKLSHKILKVGDLISCT